MPKRLVLLVILLVGSFLCFYPPFKDRYFDWSLFVVAFLMTTVFLFWFFGKVKPKRTEKNQHFESIYEALPQGILLLNSRGGILYINQKAEALIENSRLNLLGKSLSELKSEGNLLIEKSKHLFIRVLEKKTEQRFSVSFERAKTKACDLILKPIPNTDQFLLLMEDSSHQYQMQQLGKDFVANASHELRTPITIIKGFAETLSELPEISEAMFHDFIEKIIRNCERMDGLVKNLLILTDLDYLPKARLQECDLVALVDNCVHTLLDVHPNITIEALQNKEIITILADPDLLELALMNLLENGVKYSPSPANLTITIESREEEVRLTIADQGIGIPSEDLGYIFERFFTVNKAHSRRLGGAGLGLSIVKTIMQKHDGTIEVASELGKGTQFQLTFLRSPCKV